MAERKVTSLLRAGALVTVCSPSLTPALTALQTEGAFHWRSAVFQPGDTAGYLLVIAATDNDAANRMIAAEAKAQGTLVNVVTSPEAGNFQVAATVVSGDILLTVSTGGKSPALARLIRQELTELYGAEINAFLQFVEEQRQQLKTMGGTAKDREAFWRQVLPPEWLAWLRQGRREEIEGKIRDAVSCFRIKS